MGYTSQVNAAWADLAASPINPSPAPNARNNTTVSSGNLMPFEGARGSRRVDLGLVGRAVVFHNVRFKLTLPVPLGNLAIKSDFTRERWFVLVPTRNDCACPSTFRNRPKQTAPRTDAANDMAASIRGTDCCVSRLAGIGNNVKAGL